MGLMIATVIAIVVIAIVVEVLLVARRVGLLVPRRIGLLLARLIGLRFALIRLLLIGGLTALRGVMRLEAARMRLRCAVVVTLEGFLVADLGATAALGPVELVALPELLLRGGNQ